MGEQKVRRDEKQIGLKELKGNKPKNRRKRQARINVNGQSILRNAFAL